MVGYLGNDGVGSNLSKKILKWLSKRYKLLLRLIFSSGLLWYILSTTDLSAIIQSFRLVNHWWLFAAFLTLFIGKLLSGYRWQKLLNAHKLIVPLPLLIKSLFVGQFFNSFLPSTIGGDAIRVYDIALYCKKITRSLTTIFIDRLIGVFSLIFVGLVALGIGIYLNFDVAVYCWIIVGSFIAILGIFLAIFNRRLANLSDNVLRFFKMNGIADKARYATKAITDLKHERRLLGESFIISILFQINVILYYYFCAQALALEIRLIYFFLFTPIVLIILLLPFTINGIGLRESSYIYFFGIIGTGSGEAIAFSWLSFGLMLTQGIIGGIIFAFRDRKMNQINLDTLKIKVDKVNVDQ
jgi:glycosyltransferase 2 family protein